MLCWDHKTDERPPFSLPFLHRSQELSPSSPYSQEDARTSKDAQNSLFTVRTDLAALWDGLRGNCGTISQTETLKSRGMDVLQSVVHASLGTCTPVFVRVSSGQESRMSGLGGGLTFQLGHVIHSAKGTVLWWWAHLKPC